MDRKPACCMETLNWQHPANTSTNTGRDEASMESETLWFSVLPSRPFEDDEGKADQNQKLLLDCYGYLLGLLKILKVHAHYYLIDVKLYFHASSCSSANALRNQVSSSSEVGRMQTH